MILKMLGLIIFIVAIILTVRSYRYEVDSGMNCVNLEKYSCFDANCLLLNPMDRQCTAMYSNGGVKCPLHARCTNGSYECLEGYADEFPNNRNFRCKGVNEHSMSKSFGKGKVKFYEIIRISFYSFIVEN